MEDKLTKAIEAVHMDEHCVKKIEQAMAENKPCRSPARPMLRIAAALCILLLLPFSVFGVSQLWDTVTLGSAISTKEESFYRVDASTSQWPMDSFREKLRNDLNTNSLQRVFQDKAELEEYLGISLIQSTALEEAGIVDTLPKSIRYGFDLYPELEVDPSARYILTAADLDGTESTGDPELLKVTCHRVMENTEIFLEAWIITDQADAEELEAGIAGEHFHPVTGHYLDFPLDDNGDFILDENGIPTAVLKPYTSAEQTFTVDVYPMANGGQASIVTAQQVEHDGRGGFREYMGYFLHEGILYTVKPYAIYDPTLPYPMYDYDALTTLKNVLDTFE